MADERSGGISGWVLLRGSFPRWAAVAALAGFCLNQHAYAVNAVMGICLWINLYNAYMNIPVIDGHVLWMLYDARSICELPGSAAKLQFSILKSEPLSW